MKNINVDLAGTLVRVVSDKIITYYECELTHDAVYDEDETKSPDVFCGDVLLLTGVELVTVNNSGYVEFVGPNGLAYMALWRLCEEQLAVLL